MNPSIIVGRLIGDDVFFFIDDTPLAGREGEGTFDIFENLVPFSTRILFACLAIIFAVRGGS
jgi:hypothetical protein